MHQTDKTNPIALALEKALDGYLLKGEKFTFEIEKQNLRIHLKGPRWTGVVDSAVASFLLELDKRIREELVRHAVPIPKDDHGFVVLRVSEGSLIAQIEINPEILNALADWPTEAKIVVATTFVVALGVWKGFEYLKVAAEAKTEQIKANKDTLMAEAHLKLVDTLCDITRDAANLQAPTRKLIGKMTEADLITLPGAVKPVKKDDAKIVLSARTTRSKSRTYYIDQLYVVESLTTKPKKWEIGLRYGTVSFKAKLELSDKEVSKLLADYETAHAKGSEISPPLQVTAEISPKGIRSAIVVGIGKPRPNNKGIAAALKAEKDKK